MNGWMDGTRWAARRRRSYLWNCSRLLSSSRSMASCRGPTRRASRGQAAASRRSATLTATRRRPSSRAKPRHRSVSPGRRSSASSTGSSSSSSRRRRRRRRSCRGWAAAPATRATTQATPPSPPPPPPPRLRPTPPRLATTTSGPETTTPSTGLNPHWIRCSGGIGLGARLPARQSLSEGASLALGRRRRARHLRRRRGCLCLLEHAQVALARRPRRGKRSGVPPQPNQHTPPLPLAAATPLLDGRCAVVTRGTPRALQNSTPGPDRMNSSRERTVRQRSTSQTGNAESHGRLARHLPLSASSRHRLHRTRRCSHEAVLAP